MPIFGLDNVIVGIIFLFFAFYCFLITRDVNHKRQKETDKENLIELREGVYNGALTAVLCIAMALMYIIPGVTVALASGTVEETCTLSMYLLYPTPTATFAIYFLGFIFVFIALFVVYEWKTEKFSKAPPPEKKIHKLDKELSRKAFHILIIGVLAIYLIVGRLVVDSLYTWLTTTPYDYWGYSGVAFYSDTGLDAIVQIVDGGRLITMFGITVVFEFVVLLDLIRLKAPRYFPARMLSNLYREKEKDTFGPHVYLITGMLFAVLVFPPPIAMAVIAISALGDATATIVGVTKGKHKIRPDVSKKTWEGSIAGMAASFLFGLIGFIALAFTIYREPWFEGMSDGLILSIGLIVNAIAVPIFFLIDYYTPKPLPLSDNLLNPILIGFTMWGVYLLF